MKNTAHCWLTMPLGVALVMTPLFALAAPSPQVDGMNQSAGKQLPSPPADASVALGGKSVSIHYNSPSIRGRKIMGGLVPYGKVWRTGANPATAFKTATDLKIGDAKVPAGSYTLYTLPAEGTWMLIVNKQTGQWGTEYSQAQDLVRIPMKKAVLPASQEKMSISFENTHGATTELHVRWETTDVSVMVSAQ